MKCNPIATIASLLPLLALSAAGQYTGGDDFTDPARDATKWGPADLGSPEASWLEKGGRLHFQSDFPSYGFSQSLRTWVAHSPGTGADWVASLDVQLGSTPLGEAQGVSIGLDVANGSNPDDHVELELQLFSADGFTVFRQVESSLFNGGAGVGIGDVHLLLESLQLQLRYDSLTHMLVAGFIDASSLFQPVTSWDTALWGMKAGSTFQISIEGRAFGTGVTVGHLSADNFVIREQAPASAAPLAGTDDFNDGSRSLPRWGSVDVVHGGGALDETAGGVRYSTPGVAGGEEDLAARIWAAGTGEFDRSWSAQVDLILPAVQLGDGTETEIGLVVVNAADPGDRAVVSLDLAGGGTLRQFHTGVSRDGVAFSDLDALSPTTSTTAAVRARWDAAQKKLFLDYDPNGPVGGYSWTTLAIYSLTLGDSSWEMGSGGRFQVGIFGASYRGTVVPASAGVQLDNFVVASDQPAPLPIRIDPVRRAGTKLHLTWTGGRGPFQVQQRATVAGGVWGNIGASTATPALDVDMPGNFGFFRILDLGQ